MATLYWTDGTVMVYALGNDMLIEVKADKYALMKSYLDLKEANASFLMPYFDEYQRFVWSVPKDKFDHLRPFLTSFKSIVLEDTTLFHGGYGIERRFLTKRFKDTGTKLRATTYTFTPSQYMSLLLLIDQKDFVERQFYLARGEVLFTPPDPDPDAEQAPDVKTGTLAAIYTASSSPRITAWSETPYKGLQNSSFAKLINELSLRYVKGVMPTFKTGDVVVFAGPLVYDGKQLVMMPTLRHGNFAFPAGLTTPPWPFDYWAMVTPCVQPNFNDVTMTYDYVPELPLSKIHVMERVNPRAPEPPRPRDTIVIRVEKIEPVMSGIVITDPTTALQTVVYFPPLNGVPRTMAQIRDVIEKDAVSYLINSDGTAVRAILDIKDPAALLWNYQDAQRVAPSVGKVKAVIVGSPKKEPSDVEYLERLRADEEARQKEQDAINLQMAAEYIAKLKLLDAAPATVLPQATVVPTPLVSAALPPL